MTPSKGLKLLASPGRLVESQKKDYSSRSASATKGKDKLSDRLEDENRFIEDPLKKKVFTPSQAASLVCEDSQKSFNPAQGLGINYNL